MSFLPRRAALRLLAGLTLVIAAGDVAQASERDAAVRQPIVALQTALFAVMKAGRTTPFIWRCAMLAPTIERSFDMPSVLQSVVGLRWTSLSGAQQAELQTAFFRYSVATWVANFDSYSGQTFRFLPGDRRSGSDRFVVQTELLPASGTPHRMDFVLRLTANGWRIVDVLADGSISQIAVLRSDFRGLLADGTGAALSASLEKKVADLSLGSAA